LGFARGSEIIPNYGTKKYLRLSDEKAELNEEKIEQDSQWDGLHGVITNVSKDDLSTQAVLMRYRDLWRIEEAFRLSKHDLKMRPIYHFKSERIIAHVALCFMAFTVMKHALYHLEKHDLPMSFEQLRNELLHAQSSILVDKRTNKMYVLPSKTTQNLRAIYSAFGIHRRETPYVFA
jgi:transposase